MNRRNFFIMLSGATTLLFNSKAECAYECEPGVHEGTQLGECQFGISSFTLQTARQAMPQWCWAACISMIFKYYRHPVNQLRIVNDTWGGIVNMPGTPEQILRALNKTWTDDYRRSFSVSTARLPMGDPLPAILVDLGNDQPLIIGTKGHAVVLTKVSMTRFEIGKPSRVTDVIVRDPWPTAGGKRQLTLDEWDKVTFIARIQVADL